VDVINDERTRRWSYTRETGDRESPFVVRAEGELICRVRSRADADSICGRRTATLREAGQRAADLRRHTLQLKQVRNDVQSLLLVLEEIGQVLRLAKPRDIVRAREDVRKILRRMQGRGYAP
jgi:hypothetical protein